jgi:hypothetical protein
MIWPSQLARKDARTYRERKMPKLASRSQAVPSAHALLLLPATHRMHPGGAETQVSRREGGANPVDATSEHNVTSSMRALLT